ncbi:hypothetical protein G5B37_11470 [Rasiella rasia]|uniref:Uncharacterized protein n=1 Tax=Rasiella rasia TaxID=2744027 RepID=A0A6G6GNR2_9FLAO|nr:hypothetical protein [Rasiella rasia]QIE60157.1 hypothetical protein G5B37_11470 [Rasiella rasia]
MNKKILLISLLLVWVTLPVDAQCAMCRAVLESEESGAAAKGINNGIIYLMLIPYILVGGIGYAIYRLLKKSRRTNN